MRTIMCTSFHHDEAIEIISVQSDDQNHGNCDNSCNDTMGSSANYDCSPSTHEPIEKLQVQPLHRESRDEEIKTKKQKLVGRVVAVVALLMLLTSILLVGITLSMSSHIDDMVRKMNGDLPGDAPTTTQSPAAIQPLTTTALPPLTMPGPSSKSTRSETSSPLVSQTDLWTLLKPWPLEEGYG